MAEDGRTIAKSAHKKGNGNVSFPKPDRTPFSESMSNEACEIAEWAVNLDPEIRSPEKGFLGVLYRCIGFPKTELLLRLRRKLLALFKAKTKAQSLQLK
jgi:hypothetical protein